MKTLGWIAINGFREAVRDKVMYSLVAFAILLIAVSYLLGQLTAGQDLKIMKDLGLSSIACGANHIRRMRTWPCRWNWSKPPEPGLLF